MHNTWLGEFELYKKLQENATEKLDNATTRKYYIRMDKSCCKRADHLICISDVIKNETKRYGITDDKMTIIHNGIDADRFQVKNNFRSELGLDGPVIGYIGRLEPHKGVEHLLRAAVNIDAEFLLVGGGSDQNRLEELVKKLGIQNKTKLTGYVPYEEIPAYYATVDMVVYPTLYEPLGNVVLESMAAGKPIIASNVDGIPEIFKPGTGYLVKPDPKELEEKINLLIADEPTRKKMGEEGKKKVKEHSWVEVAKQTIEVCERVLES
jgi:glycosyltransferase involved in cell wall biosynthesis